PPPPPLHDALPISLPHRHPHLVDGHPPGRRAGEDCGGAPPGPDRGAGAGGVAAGDRPPAAHRAGVHQPAPRGASRPAAPGPECREAGLMHGKARTGPSLWLLIPAVLPILLLSVIPLLQGMSLGFTDYRLGPREPQFTGLDNYQYMLTDYKFWSSFKTGAIWAVAVTAGAIILGLGLALLLNAGLPLQGLARVLILIPWDIGRASCREPIY